MIQRIQTLYLLASVALMALFFWAPLATFATGEGIFSLSVMGITSSEGETIYSTLYFMIIAGLALLLPLVNIFLFKRRMLQLRLCVVEIVLLVGTLVVGGVYYHLSNRFFGGVEMADAVIVSASPRIVCIMPLVAIYCSYKAFKAIFRDEMLIKSLDRIR